MYRIRYSIVMNKPYLPTVRQFSVLPGEVFNKPYLPTVRQFSVFPYFKVKAFNKPYLPTVRKFSIFPNFKEEKEKLEKKIKELEQIRNQEMVEKVKEIMDHEIEINDLNHKIKDLTIQHENEKARIKSCHGVNEKSHLNELVDLRLKNEFDKEVLKKEITRLEKEIIKRKADRDNEIGRMEADRKLEIARLEKDRDLKIERMEADRKLEIERMEADRKLEKIKTGYLNLNYLKLKGSVHLRGVFEQWELFSLSAFKGNRTERWTDYLKTNKDVFEKFQNFYSEPKDIRVDRVVAEMTNFYKLLSERIHNAHAAGDQIEWRRNSLTPVLNKISEHMCKELNLEYRIVESSETIEEVEWKGDKQEMSKNS